MNTVKSLNFIAIIFLISLSSCTTPQRQTTFLPPAQPTPQSTPIAEKSDKLEFFTMGSTMDEVASVMGTPQQISGLFSEVWWNYGYSRITFMQGRVTGWNNIGNNLKVRWSATRAANSPQTTSAAVPVVRQATPSPDARQIDAQVATILAGQHSPLPPAQHVRSNPASQVAEMVTKNNTQYTLTVLYSGPTSQRVVLAPQASQKVLLSVGTYQVAATVNSSSVVPFAGRDEIQGGGYDNTFYIETTRM